MVVAAAILAVVSVALTLRAHAAGGHATSVQLKMPTAAVPMSGGDVLIADSENHVVRKVDPSGNIATVAGDGADCGALCAPDGLKMGDGGPATKAELDDPTDAVPYPGGGFLIADATDNLDGPGTIRYVNASGIISTAAGGAATVCGASTDLIGDGCPATQAKLANPTAAVPVAGGGFLIADSFDAVVRRVGADGKIQTVAGIAPGRSTTPCTGSDGLGNGCPANEVQMGLPMAAIPYNIAGAAVGDADADRGQPKRRGSRSRDGAQAAPSQVAAPPGPRRTWSPSATGQRSPCPDVSDPGSPTRHPGCTASLACR